MTLHILLISLTLIFAFFGLGIFVQELLKLKRNFLLNYVIGILAFLGFIQVFYYGFVYYKWPPILFFVLLGILLVLGIIKGLIRLIQFKFDFNVSLTLIIGFLFMGWMVFLNARQTLGFNTFDYNHYLSMVLNNATAAHFGWLDYGNGQATAINIQYDYQSYYAFGSFVLALYEPIQRLLSPNLFLITSGLYVWVFSILFYALEYALVVGLMIELKQIKKWSSPLILLILLGYFSSIYYNMVFAFFGNSYRTMIVAYLSFELIQSLKDKDLSLRKSLWVMLVSSSLISVSSTGFFIGAMALTAYVVVLFRDEIDFKVLMPHLICLMFPTAFYAFLFLRINPLLAFGIFVMIGLVLMSFIKLNTNIQSILFKGVKSILWFVLPIGVLSYGVLQTIQGASYYPSFFFDHRAYDMVWYFFNTEDWFKTTLNVLFLGSMLFYLIKRKDVLKWFIITLIIVFINPISTHFVHRYLASVVYYRSFEVILNPFTLIVFLSFIFNLFQSQKLNKFLALGLSLVLIPNVLSHMFYYYHYSFIPSKNYNQIYKLENSQIELLSVLKTKILMEGYKDARIVSQIEGELSHLPNAMSIYSNNLVRGIDKEQIQPVTNKLLNIFLLRDYIGQQIFEPKANYESTCFYLIVKKVDFVIVDKSQHYIDETGNIIPLFFRVRDCSTQIYENEQYLIYQFYW